MKVYIAQQFVTNISQSDDFTNLRMLALPQTLVPTNVCSTPNICPKKELFRQYFFIWNIASLWCASEKHSSPLVKWQNQKRRKMNKKGNKKIRIGQMETIYAESHFHLHWSNCIIWPTVNVFIALIIELWHFVFFWSKLRIRVLVMMVECVCACRFWGVFHHLILCYVPFFSFPKNR